MKYIWINAVILILAISVVSAHVVLGDTKMKPDVDLTRAKIAYFAGGCFWCTEAAFEEFTGVIAVTSGFSGGHVQNPTYEQVVTGTTGHKESVKVYYDPKKTNFSSLVEHFWKNTNPTDDKGQFADKGEPYKTAIFYQNAEEKRIAEKSKEQLEKSGRFDRSIVTEILPFKNFYEAESYHQDFYKTSSNRYNSYKKASGRDEFFEEVWDNEEDNKMKNGFSTDHLTDMQYKVTQKDGTEPAFQNEYWDNKKEGIYVDIVSGKALFSSTDKYDSGTGWPSFTKPINDSQIVTKTDFKLIFPRTEARSKDADSHLGHVFNDGPKEEGGKRYCMNSAAMRFIPKEKLKEEGYEEYLKLFE